MSALDIVLAVLVIICAILMVILFLVQEGNDRGMGAIAGGTTDSYYSKSKGRSLEERLKFFTKIVAICFACLSVALYILLARGI